MRMVSHTHAYICTSSRVVMLYSALNVEQNTLCTIRCVKIESKMNAVGETTIVVAMTVDVSVALESVMVL